jgi:hypothetical protein
MLKYLFQHETILQILFFIKVIIKSYIATPFRIKLNFLNTSKSWNSYSYCYSLLFYVFKTTESFISKKEQLEK